MEGKCPFSNKVGEKCPVSGKSNDEIEDKQFSGGCPLM